MKIARSLPILIVFITVLSSSFAQLAGAPVVAFNDYVIHDDYTVYVSNGNDVEQLDTTDLPTPYISNSPLIIAQTFELQHIDTSAGNQTSTIQICSGESLTLIATFRSAQTEYEYVRVRGGVTSTIVFRPGTTSHTLTPNNLIDGDVYYIISYDLDGGQIIESDHITVRVNVLPLGVTPFDGGTIIPNDQVVCPENFPATLTTTGSVAPTDVNYNFQWEQSIDNGFTFTAIPSATNFNYSFTEVITQTTFFRRTTEWALGGACIKYSNVHQITVLDLDPGRIKTANTTICFDEAIPLLENDVAANTNTGQLSYEWQVSTDGTQWTDTGHTQINYQPTGTLTQTTFYRRKSIQTGNTRTCESFSNTITMTVVNAISMGTFSGAQTICRNAIPSPLQYSLPLNPLWNYQWQHSTDGVTYTDIVGQTQQQLTFAIGAPFLPTQTTFYRMAIQKTELGIVCAAETESVTVVVLPVRTTLSSDAPNNTVCSGEDVTITAQGSNTYQFIVNGIVRTDATSRTLTLTNLTQTTTVTVQAFNQGCVSIQTITINVLNIEPGDVILTVDSCTPGAYAIQSQTPGLVNQNSLTAMGGNYQWQLSVNGGTTWQNIFGANSETLNIGGTFSFAPPVHYRRLTQINTCQQPSNAIFIAQTPTLSGGNVALAQQIICRGAVPQTNVLTATGGNESSQVSNLVNYQWEISLDDGFSYSDIVGQTSPSLTLGTVTQTSRFRRKVSWINDPSCPE